MIRLSVVTVRKLVCGVPAKAGSFDVCCSASRVSQLLREAGRGDHADPAAADVERVTGADFGREIGRDVAVALKHRRRGVGQAHREVAPLRRGRLVERAALDHGDEAPSGSRRAPSSKPNTSVSLP